MVTDFSMFYDFPPELQDWSWPFEWDQKILACGEHNVPYDSSTLSSLCLCLIFLHVAASTRICFFFLNNPLVRKEKSLLTNKSLPNTINLPMEYPLPKLSRQQSCLCFHRHKFVLRPRFFKFRRFSLPKREGLDGDEEGNRWWMSLFPLCLVVWPWLVDCQMFLSYLICIGMCV